jgi:2-methylisocitrate lyase-like PEP mutase family enzyme
MMRGPEKRVSSVSPARLLRGLLAEERLLMAPGASDALTARIIELAGYPICYFTGAGFANTQFALPDVGLVTLSESVEQVRRVAAAVQVPVIADADTGYGNALNVIRTVREYEAAGAAGLQLEDQVSPKRCGHFSGKAVVSCGEMVKKIEAAAGARRDPDFVIVARIDAISVEGLDIALTRARAYAAAGADVLFVEAPRSIEELQRIPAEVPDRPHLVNVTPSGITPCGRADTLAEFGYRLAIYPNVALQAAVKATQQVLSILRDTGDLTAVEDRLIGWSERQSLVGLPEIQALEQKYLQI